MAAVTAMAIVAKVYRMLSREALDQDSDMPATDAVMDVSVVLLLVTDGPAADTSILIAAPDAPSFVVLGGDTEEGFARLRSGAVVYGMPETYQALPRDMVRDHGRVLEVWPERFLPARLDHSGSLFGANPEKLLVPVRENGKPFDRVRVPIPSLEKPSVLEFALSSSIPSGLDYRLAGPARERAGYICSYCGRLCEQKEPHTAAHGVAGHVRSGAVPGQVDLPGRENEVHRTRL
jgi:hypothetical protein